MDVAHTSSLPTVSCHPNICRTILWCSSSTMSNSIAKSSSDYIQYFESLKKISYCVSHLGYYLIVSLFLVLCFSPHIWLVIKLTITYLILHYFSQTCYCYYQWIWVSHMFCLLLVVKGKSSIDKHHSSVHRRWIGTCTHMCAHIHKYWKEKI